MCFNFNWLFFCFLGQRLPPNWVGGISYNLVDKNGICPFEMNFIKNAFTLPTLPLQLKKKKKNMCF